MIDDDQWLMINDWWLIIDDGEYLAKMISLGETFSDPYFEQKYILHFDARDVPRARKPKQEVY